MNVVIKGVHCHVSDRLKEHTQRHLVEPMERFFESEAAWMEVHFVEGNGDKAGLDKECRVSLHIPGAKTMHIDQPAEDHYKALDLLRDRLEKTLKREKEKMRNPARGTESAPTGQGSGMP